MSLPLKRTATAKHGRVMSDAGQACRECRRRKGKCDGKLPVCSVCQRYNRHCLYDKHSRSALTRKHLTEVEERLERAEALLRTFFTEAELSQMLVHEISDRSGATFSLSGGPATTYLGHEQESVPPSASGTAFLSGSATLDPQHQPDPFPPGSTGLEQVGSLQSPQHSGTNAPDNNSVLFENVPTAADDGFEWDERESFWSLGDPGGTPALDSGLDADVSRITDGMATLTANDSNTGFLGSVSGAALLRLISMTTAHSDETGEASDLRDQRRNSLEQFLSLHATDQSAPGQWLRTQPLLTRAVVDTLVDAYFAHYHPTFPILHEATFRDQYRSLNQQPKGTWHILANLVAALGSFVSSTCSDDTDITLFNAVKVHLSIDCLEAGSLGLVQAFAMAANYLQKRNRPNSGYNYGGVALRLAISLGLHKEFHGWQTSPLKKEIRRRVWWSLCVLDVGATVTYGRPLNWPQVGVDTAFPLNIHEKDLTIDSTSPPQELSQTTVYSYVRTQSAYHLRTIRIYNRLISNPVPSAAELVSLDDEIIEGWRKSLPHYFCDEALTLSNEYLLGHSISRWRFRIMRIIMYRPFLLRWAQDGFGPLQQSSSPSSQDQSYSSMAESMATIRCFKAAEECISILYRFWTSATHTRLAAWYVLYFLMQAVLIPIHCLRRNPAHADASSWRIQVLKALDIISAMTNINSSAPKCRDIIYRLCGESLDQGSAAEERDINPSTSNPFPYDLSAPDPNDPSIDSWMTEIDTAIDGYDIYCNQLSNAAVARMGDLGGPSGNEHNNGSTAPNRFGIPGWGTEVGTGGQDWDWGLML